uniref:Uncharacterized protein n=1 Tax=Solanum tuberosum TaxID=4113 RepID=M1D4W5_SOLTU
MRISLVKFCIFLVDYPFLSTCVLAWIFASECDNPDYLTLGLLDTGFGAIIHHCRQL